MQVGDLIRIRKKELRLLRADDFRRIGTLLKFSIYEGACGVIPGSQRSERIVEVLWNTGEVGWILLERIELAKGDKGLSPNM